MSKPMSREVFESGGKLVVRIPFEVRRPSGRKQVIYAQGTSPTSSPADRAKDKLALAVARGVRWLELIESGRFSSPSELARAIGVDTSYVVRLMNLALLPPDVVKRIAFGTCPAEWSIEDFRKVSELWQDYDE